MEKKEKKETKEDEAIWLLCGLPGDNLSSDRCYPFSDQLRSWPRKIISDLEKNIVATNNFGVWYATEFPRQEVEVVECFKIAAQRKLPAAICNLAVYEGYKMLESRRAKGWRKLYATLSEYKDRFPAAHFNVGILELLGWGTKKKPDTTLIKVLKEMPEQVKAVAERLVKEGHDSAPLNKTAALDKYRKAGRLGNAKGLLYAREIYMKQERPKQAAACLARAVKLGHPHAFFAHALETNDVKLLEKAVEAKYVFGMLHQAQMHQTGGFGYPLDHNKAFEILQQVLIIQANTKALLTMGYCYEHGQGTKKDVTKAAECYYRVSLAFREERPIRPEVADCDAKLVAIRKRWQFQLMHNRPTKGKETPFFAGLVTSIAAFDLDPVQKERWRSKHFPCIRSMIQDTAFTIGVDGGYFEDYYFHATSPPSPKYPEDVVSSTTSWTVECFFVVEKMGVFSICCAGKKCLTAPEGAQFGAILAIRELGLILVADAGRDCVYRLDPDTFVLSPFSAKIPDACGLAYDADMGELYISGRGCIWRCKRQPLALDFSAVLPPELGKLISSYAIHLSSTPVIFAGRQDRDAADENVVEDGIARATFGDAQGMLIDSQQRILFVYDAGSKSIRAVDLPPLHEPELAFNPELHMNF